MSGAADEPGAPVSAARPWAGRRLHFVGVGGAGMSGYARAAHELGAQVTGSDRAASPFSAQLAADGVLVAAIGHDAANVPGGDGVEVVYSSAIPPANPERAAARARGLAEHPRADLLAQLSALRRTIAVAGAHGKTTTSSMLAHVLLAAGLDPGWLVGGAIGAGRGNAHWGEGEWLVVEADESDRSMLSLNVQIAVLTNVELDHHASFGSERELRDVFRTFLVGAPQAVIWDRPELLELRDGAGGEVVAFDVPDAALTAGGSTFRRHGVQVTLAVPGAHNALNAAAALETAVLAGVEPQVAADALVTFRGAGRRFQRVGTAPSGAEVYDDYAHHPTEIAATLRAARTLAPARLVAVFQPHLYSRTARLAREFGEALALADVVAVLDVYGAREDPADHPGVSGLDVAVAAAGAARGRPVLWLPTFDDAAGVLGAQLREGDLVAVMGAGDVDALGRPRVAGAHPPQTQ